MTRQCVRVSLAVTVSLLVWVVAGCKPTSQTAADKSSPSDAELLADGLTERTAVRALKHAQKSTAEIEARQAEQLKELESFDAAP